MTLPSDESTLTALTEAQQAAIAAYGEQARQQYTQLSENIRKEFRENLSDLLNKDIKGFVSEAKKALSELTSDSQEGSSGESADLGDPGQNFAIDLFGEVMNGLLSGKKLDRRKLANNVARDFISNFFPDLGGSSRGAQSRGQAAADLGRLLNLGQRLF